MITADMASKIPNKEFLRPKEVAAILCCDEDHVFNLIHDGNLTAINITRNPVTRPFYRVHTKSLREFIGKRLEGAR